MKEVNPDTFEKTSDFLDKKVGQNYFRFLTNPFSGNFHEMNTATGFKSIECKGANCDMCAKSKYAPIKKYTWIAIDRVNKKVGILKLSKGLAEKIILAQKAIEDGRNKDIEITRMGTKKEDTKYTFKILDIDKPLSVEENQIIADSKPLLMKKYIL